jgi:hypothetical protein
VQWCVWLAITFLAESRTLPKYPMTNYLQQAYHTALANSVFWHNVKPRSSSMADFKNRKAESFRYLNINLERRVLKDSQNIAEELKISKRAFILRFETHVSFNPRAFQLMTYGEVEGHYKQQLVVLKILKQHLKNRLDKVSSSPGKSGAISVEKLDFEEAADLIEKIESRMAEINDLQTAADRSIGQVCVSLSPKLLSLICS